MEFATVKFAGSEREEYYVDEPTLHELRESLGGDKNGYLEFTVGNTDKIFQGVSPEFKLRVGTVYTYIPGNVVGAVKTVNIKMVEKGDDIIIITVREGSEPLHMIIKRRLELAQWLPETKRSVKATDGDPFGQHRLFDSRGVEVGDVQCLSANATYTYAVPMTLTPEPANRWRSKQLAELKFVFEDVDFEHLYFRRYGSFSPSAEAQQIITELDALTLDVVGKYKEWFNWRQSTTTAPTETESDELKLLQNELTKAIYLDIKYYILGTPADMFVMALLRRLGFCQEWLMLFQQFHLNLKFGSMGRESVSDFTILDVLSFPRMTVTVDKVFAAEFLNSEPQLIAELIALYQAANLARRSSPITASATPTAATVKTGTFSGRVAPAGSAESTSATEADELDADLNQFEAIIGVRVSGTRMWFYHIADPSTVLHAMHTNKTAPTETTVARVGGEVGFNFLEAAGRTQIILALDQIRQEFQASGRQAQRKISHTPQEPCTSATTPGSA